mmetsp:Transcript_83415/g.250024  ORF Transcript_83415/g.250024 Transcript_83415/m.250024 type:complete len:226 (+) Transcript_83415:139-816(+)
MKHYCKLSCGMCKKVTFEDLMKDIDANADGKVSLAELSDQLAKARMVHSILDGEANETMSDEAIDDWLNPAGSHGSEVLDDYKELDKNVDGFLDANETKGELEPLPEEMMEYSEESGMDKEEFDMEMTQMKEYSKLRMELADKNRDGRLDQREFVFFRMGADSHPDMRMLHVRHQETMTAFEAKRHMKDFDLDGNGEIDGEELAEAHERLSDITHPFGIVVKEEL